MSDNNLNPPNQSPVVPNMLTDDSRLSFRCHKDIACFNACCKNIDITLAPYDILRLQQHLGMSSAEFLPKYTIPFEMDAQGMPGVKFRPVDGGTACQFMTEEGCSVYENRPTACRYYPLGLLSIKHKDAATDEQSYALVSEEHCLGHQEDRPLSVGEYRAEQGVDVYDEHTRGWRQLILKKKSAGPSIGTPSKQSLQLFFMASYNVDQFQEFVLSDQFLGSFELEPELIEQLKTDKVAVLDFGVRFLRQVLYGEKTINEKENAHEAREAHLKKRAEETRELARLEAEAAAQRAKAERENR
ncbi:MAG: YkgJ family cysteine cluster protein [Gammaproteobacteria bacterium]|nr:YkgJ family cysteine cluster protein [Gammaproteobacteria bacterium]